MPWKETCVNEERMKFIVAWKQGGWSITDLCREFGISRKTGYKYIKRFQKYGLDGLKDEPRKPHKHPNAVSARTKELVIQARKKHPLWGPKKLLAAMQYRYPSIRDWPSKNTVGRIIDREGLIKSQTRRKKSTPVQPLSHVTAPNDVWCADYKGHFTVGNGQRCTPLTVTDAHSRFLIECRIVPSPDTESAKAVFTDLFRRFGLPEAIRTDNGTPFAARSLAGLSRLSVWWLKLGIQLERIEPGKPQQNGRHERMHRTLKQSTALPPRSTLEAQQRAFNEFKQEYNYDRPHEALRNRFPADLYAPSGRTFPEILPEVAYPTNMETQKVNDAGNIICGSRLLFLTGALSGEIVGLEEISENHTRIHFCQAVLGVFDHFTRKFLRYSNPMSMVSEERKKM